MDTDGGVLRIIIDRPARKNSLDPAAVRRMIDALEAAATDDSALGGGIIEAMADEAMALELSSRTADFREGLLAFTQRRDARFEGR